MNHNKPVAPARPLLPHEQTRIQRTQAGIQPKKRPVAPPVFKPQQAMNQLQRKANPQNQERTRQPVAPPVYRPEPKKFIQTKSVPPSPRLQKPQSVPNPRPFSPKPNVTTFNRGANHIRPGVPPSIQKIAATIPRPPVAKQPPDKKIKAGINFNLRSTIQRLPQVIQRVTTKELNIELSKDSTFKKNYQIWLKDKISLTQKNEAQIISRFDISGLRKSVGTYMLHHENQETVIGSLWDVPFPLSLITSKVDYAKELLKTHYEEGVTESLLKSKTLILCAGSKLGKSKKELEKMISEAIGVVDQKEYQSLQIKEWKERGLAPEQELTRMDYSHGFRIGNKFYLRLGTGTPPESFHVPIHEFMHFLSSVFSKKELGHELNEGLTERITIVVMIEAGLKIEGAYKKERQKVARLVKLLNRIGLGEIDLFKFYFDFINANANVIEAVKFFANPEQYKVSNPDMAYGTDIAQMYGWSDQTVFEMAIKGEFRNQVLARQNRGPTPSYIA